MKGRRGKMKGIIDLRILERIVKSRSGVWDRKTDGKIDRECYDLEFA